MLKRRLDLSSEERAGTFARRKARTNQRLYVRKNWRRLLIGYVLLASLATLPTLLWPNEFLRGVGVGAGLAGSAGAIVAMVIIQTGTGPTMAGELAEQWTAQEVKDLVAHGYRFANHVDVDGRGDADHILVGPGGLFVLETKWSATEWAAEDRFFAGPLDQVRARARNTWLQVKRHDVPSATPVLVLWGKAGEGIAEGPGARRNGDAVVVAGTHLRRWLLGRPAGVLTPDQVTKTYDTICDIARRSDMRAAAVPPSLWTYYWRAAGVVALAATCFTAPFYLTRAGLWAFFTAAAALSIGGLLLARRGHRMWGWTIMVGAGAALALVVGIFIVTYARLNH